MEGEEWKGGVVSILYTCIFFFFVLAFALGVKVDKMGIIQSGEIILF